MSNCPLTDSTDTIPDTMTVALRIQLSDSARMETPVTFGVPFPRHQVREPFDITFRDADGTPCPAAASVTAKWPDGSVQWMLIDTVLPPLTAGTHHGMLNVAPTSPDQEHAAPIHAPIHAHVRDNEAIIEARGKTLAVSAANGDLRLRLVHQGSQHVTEVPIATNLTLTDGDVDVKILDRTRVETVNAVRATVAARGHFHRSELLFTARISYYIDGTIRHEFAIHNPRRARHRNGLWDLGDAGSCFFQDLSTRLSFPEDAVRHFAWRAEAAGELSQGDEPPWEDRADRQRRRELE